MSLINVFIAMVAEKLPDQVIESLRRIDEAYRGNDLLIMK
jgi:hypothetical protein